MITQITEIPKELQAGGANGARLHKALNKASAESLLSDNGYSCPANTSETPYRG
jgi:hypothetical protein